MVKTLNNLKEMIQKMNEKDIMRKLWQTEYIILIFNEKKFRTH